LGKPIKWNFFQLLTVSLCAFSVCAIIHSYTMFGCSDIKVNVYYGNSYSRRRNWGVLGVGGLLPHGRGILTKPRKGTSLHQIASIDQYYAGVHCPRLTVRLSENSEKRLIGGRDNFTHKWRRDSRTDLHQIWQVRRSSQQSIEPILASIGLRVFVLRGQE
jgi:hypothetical protein